MSNVVPLPAPEPFMTRQQLARHMQVSERTVDRWTKEGMPHKLWGARTKRFRASEAVEWASQRIKEAS